MDDERAPAIDTGAQPQLALVGDDLAQGVEHPVFVVGRCVRRSRDEEDLARAAVDVGGEEGDAVLIAGVLDPGHERIELGGGGRGAPAGQQLVKAAELRERDGHLPVLAFGGRAEVCAQGRGQRTGRVRHRALRRRLEAHGGAAGEGRDTISAIGSALLVGEHGGGRVAEQHLARLGVGLQAHDLARHRPGDDELSEAVAGEERVDGSRGDRGRRPQRHDACVGAHAAERRHRALHVPCGSAGAAGVVAAAEEQKQRVAAELQRVAAELPRGADERGEHAVERVDELLDAGLAALGQAFGQRCEAGDVEEQEAAVLLPPGARGVGCQPLAV